LLIRPAKVLFGIHTHAISSSSAYIEVLNKMAMKRSVVIIVAFILLASCSTPKAYYETKEGKRKQKYYNDIQYGKNAHPKMKF
jgi:hypothetical protein